MTAGTTLVLGSTGKTGRRVVRALRSRGVPTRAASRSAETHFDWNDRATWPAVLRDVRAAYLVAPEEPDLAAEFVKTATAAGVERFVVLSGRGVDVWAQRAGADQSMIAAERAVRDSGAEWAIMRANNFAQNFSEDLYHAPLLAGRLALPTGGVPEPFVDADDLAEVAVALLTEDGHAGRTYELSGPRALGYAEAVDIIARASGRRMRFVELTPEQYEAELRADGVEDPWVGLYTSLFEVTREGLLAEPVDGVRQVLDREPTDFESYVAAAVAAGAWR
ncbi:NAD(P)H-binding protein [Micromonospora sp. C28SCA-DRY-2]|uniref:NmrA family NAD(P)-binding protein n=1 Tax=Micromonospora sp. C28SCA-DRY-2 TaxID=3059522 RepID=UPI0026744A8E|nr:NAD(P)H-binding protein [Micromonospora sp. C28SCA-DRY-2]MDO3700149.1 NAD(P)H-binding protein [Micromonospora sp. C28SCA-DRY-2]